MTTCSNKRKAAIKARSKFWSSGTAACSFSEIEPFPDGGEYSFLDGLPDPDRQPEEQVELRERRQRLLEAIETLTPNFRAVVRLRYDTQLSFREIGQALSIPAATAKTYFYRAKEPLHALLEPEFEHERGMEKQ